MMKITLPDQERQQLEAIFKMTLDWRLRAPCQAILMASQEQRSTPCFNPPTNVEESDAHTEALRRPDSLHVA
jgi:hypothetical protein